MKQVEDRPHSSIAGTSSPIDFKDPISQLRFTFWRHRSREQRLGILQELNLLSPSYPDATFSFFLVQQAFETALDKKFLQLIKAIGPPSSKQFDMYRRADPAEIEREVGQHNALDPEAVRVVSDNSLPAGYYRANQSITISFVEADSKGTLLELSYSADLIPNGEYASGFAPEVRAPKNATCDKYEYLIDGKRKKMFEDWTIYTKSQDSLTFQYRIQSEGEIDFSDDHVWPSPVINYVIRFRRKSGYKLEVFKTLSSGELEALQRTSGQEFDEFFSSGVSRAAERIIWHLSRVN